jgi:hypothetical protein
MPYRYLSEESSEEAAMRAVGTTTEPPPIAGETDAVAAEGLIFAVGRETEPDSGALFFAAGAETEPDDDTTAARGAKMSDGGGGGEPFTAGVAAGLWRPTGALLQKK